MNLKDYLNSKYLVYLLIIISLLTIIPLTVYLAQQRQIIKKRAANIATVHLDPATQDIAQNSTATIDIKIDSSEDEISFADISYTFDKDRLEAVAINYTDALDDEVRAPIIDNNTGFFRLVLRGTPSLAIFPSGNFVIATITFRGVALGIASVEPQPDMEIVKRRGTNIYSHGGSGGAQVTVVTPQVLDKVRMNPTSDINNSLLVKPNSKTGFSALAYDINNQPIWNGIQYEWWISSVNTIGSAEPDFGPITTFTARLTPGRGFLMVTAYQNRGQPDQRTVQQATEIEIDNFYNAKVFGIILDEQDRKWGPMDCSQNIVDARISIEYTTSGGRSFVDWYCSTPANPTHPVYQTLPLTFRTDETITVTLHPHPGYICESWHYDYRPDSSKNQTGSGCSATFEPNQGIEDENYLWFRYAIQRPIFTFRLKFDRLSESAPNSIANVIFRLISDNTLAFENNNLILEEVDTACTPGVNSCPRVFEGNVDLSAYTGLYDVLIKGPSHLQRNLGTIALISQYQPLECFGEVNDEPTYPMSESRCWRWNVNTKPLLSGDGNHDGRVSGIDYEAWRSAFADRVVINNTLPDYDLSGEVKGVDYDIWLQNFDKVDEE